MSTGTSEAQVREALYELQRYLSDELAPMMVADAVELLFRAGTDVMAAAVEGWVGAQYGGPAAGTVSDYLFHSVKKLHQMAEYDLIDRAAVAAHLERLTPRLVALCPEAERPLLAENLARLERIDTSTAIAPAQVLHRAMRADAPVGAGLAPGPAAPARPAPAPLATAPRPAAPAPPAATELPADVARGMRRFALLLERLASVPSGSESTPAGSPAPLETQALATAAEHARDGAEFARLVRRLDTFADGRLERVIDALSRDLPGWSLAAPAGAAGPAVPPSRSARAIGRILEMADDPHQAIHHVNAMLHAAVERFNEGALGQAAAMAELAGQGIRDKGIDPETFRELLRRTEQTLSPERLREYADRPDRHAALRRFLATFPGTTVAGLLDALVLEPKRDRRRLLLGLLEAHGESTRTECLERLERYGNGDGDDPHGYHRRNFVFLLRRIPAPAGEPRDRELRAICEASRLAQPPILLREALTALGALSQPEAERVLIERLHEVETALASGDPPQSAAELHAALDRIASSLIRHGTPAALRTVVNHAFRRQSGLGDTLSRLDELAGRDLSVDPELVGHLLRILEQELPPKVLGLVVARHADRPQRLVRLFARTPLEEVRAALGSIAEQYRGRELGEVAVAVLDGFDAPPAPEREAAASLTGDVELFGLPNLLQSLSESKVSGVLTVTTPAGETIGTVELAEGRIARCRTRHLDGEAAFYQLFERPEPGTFVFRKGESANGDPESGETHDVQSCLLEALRRYDELQQACALVPDAQRLRATGRKPTAAEGESDRALLREVWTRAASGTPPVECERDVAADSYRVRRLYAHWVESGALAPGV